MTDRELFNCWAPKGMRWTEWIRPVQFIGLDENKDFEVAHPTVPQIHYLHALGKNTAVILDLPDYHSVEEGLALAENGYRPVPLFNGCDPQNGVSPLVDNRDIKAALVFGAKKLKELDIDVDAPPAFLLDNERLQVFKLDVSLFDNSWDIYAQDMPTDKYLIENGIDKIIVRSDKIHRDLKIILKKYQKSGIQLFLCDGYNVEEIEV